MYKYVVKLCIHLFGAYLFIMPTIVYAQVEIDTDVDISQPIEIVSDSLTVRTKENIAVFKGNVKATQDVVRITANQMDVYYNSDGNKQSTSGESTIAKSINSIRVGGNVSLTMPGKKATSEMGTYDVVKGFMVLQGDVVLNNEGQILKGKKFIHNVKEGTSRMLSQDDVVHNKRVKEGKAKERVKGLFIPKRRQK